MDSIPVLSALVMLWISFLSPRWSDRMLWSAAMIFTAYELAADATYIFPYNAGAEVHHIYPSISAVVGLVAYGSWLLIIPVSTLSTWVKRALSAVCVLALLVIVAYPAIDAYTRTVDTIGAVLFAGALFTLGMFVANRVGVNLLGRCEPAASTGILAPGAGQSNAAAGILERSACGYCTDPLPRPTCRALGHMDRHAILAPSTSVASIGASGTATRRRRSVRWLRRPGAKLLPR